MAERYLKATFNTGMGETPPEALPYFVHSWVTANDRLKAAGWKPEQQSFSWQALFRLKGLRRIEI